jgi:hypothetical protein
MNIIGTFGTLFGLGGFIFAAICKNYAAINESLLRACIHNSSHA